mmetsp:Transcript_58293/g.153359  ORF Transcript_58293/g.153359 Transcript_58293/m.153359 type:complete len:143 (+) Transcript_58293:269-697(+)
MAIMTGQVITSSQISDFRRDHDARLKGGHERINSIHGMQLPSSQDPLFSYGIKSGDRVPMDSLLTNQYLKDYLAVQESKQENHQSRKHIPVMHTKASLGHRFVEPVSVESEPFKLKKFLRVPPRLKMTSNAGGQTDRGYTEN